MSKCYYCSRELASPKDGGPLAETKDHLHPKSRGGKDTVACCRQCNRMKADMSLAEWRMFMANNPNWWRTDKPIEDEITRLRSDLAAAKEAERQALVDANEALIDCHTLRADLAAANGALASVHGRIRLIEKLAGIDPLIIEECRWCIARIDAFLKVYGDE